MLALRGLYIQTPEQTTFVNVPEISGALKKLQPIVGIPRICFEDFTDSVYEAVANYRIKKEFACLYLRKSTYKDQGQETYFNDDSIPYDIVMEQHFIDLDFADYDEYEKKLDGYSCAGIEGDYKITLAVPPLNIANKKLKKNQKSCCRAAFV